MGEIQSCTFEDLANIYDKLHQGRKARTMKMDTIWDWAERRTDLFRLNEDETLTYIGGNLK